MSVPPETDVASPDETALNLNARSAGPPSSCRACRTIDKVALASEREMIVMNSPLSTMKPGRRGVMFGAGALAAMAAMTAQPKAAVHTPTYLAMLRGRA